MAPQAFHPLFERWARGVRRRLVARQAFTGLAVALVVAVVAAGIGWRTGQGWVSRYAAVLGVAGLVAGLAFARRRRWTDSDVALFLDARLDTEEAIATAVGLRNEAELQDPARAVVVTRAAEALSSADHARARPKVLKPVHVLLPLSAAALVMIARLPSPPAPPRLAPPGTTKVQLAQIDGLEKATALAELDARDEAQRQRLDKIAKDAEKLKRELAAGMEKRDAQDKIARLREDIAAERLSLGDGEHRAGLESAVGKLETHSATAGAAKALGDHDLTAMDAEMERLANEREKADRETAKHALEDAADAANKAGAPDVAKALEGEKQAMEERGRRADTLRDLADAMKGAGEAPGDVESGSEALDRKGSDAAAKKLAESMAKALEGLSPEERKKLAEKLRQQAAAKGTSRADADTMKDLAKDLATPEGQKKLEDELKEMAKGDAESDESRRQQALDQAQQGAEGAEGEIGKQGKGGAGEPGTSQQSGTPQQGGSPQPGKGEGPAGSPGSGSGDHGAPAPGQGATAGQGVPAPGAAEGSTPGAGGSHDTGTGDHRGSTGAVAADTLKSRAKGPLNKSASMPGAVTTYTAGKAGATANTRGTGDLRVVGPSEVDGVERSDVPEEYREQVRHYFQP